MRRKNTTAEMMRGYLAEALLQLLAQRPCSAITVEALCARAGVNRSTYYRHFKSKEDVVFYFYDTLMAGYLEKAQQENADLQSYLQTMFAYFYGYKSQLLLLHRRGLSLILLQVLNKHFSRAVPLDAPVLARYHAAYHIGGIFNHFLLWFSRDMAEMPEEMARTALSILPPGFLPVLWFSQEK